MGDKEGRKSGVEDLQRSRSKNTAEHNLLPGTNVQRHQHRDRHQQDQKIRHNIQYPVCEIQILHVHALPHDRGVPELGDGMTFEDEAEANGDHVADGDEEHEKDLVAEAAGRIDAQVEDEDGDFGEGDRGDVDYH